MTQVLAQATPSNPGASRSADFQPPTGNPQTVPGQVFPESPALQTQGADEVLQQGDARISVSSNPSSPTPQITEAKAGGWLIWLLVLVVLGLAALIMWWRRRPVTTTENIPEVSPVEAAVVTQPKVAKPKPQVPTKKPAPKKSKSKRKKRARRG